VTPPNAIKREQYYLDLLKPGYDIYPTAGSSYGRITSEETKLKLRVIAINRKSPSNPGLR
jgi:hypothetical protein